MYIRIGKLIIGTKDIFTINIRKTMNGVFLDIGFLYIDYWFEW